MPVGRLLPDRLPRTAVVSVAHTSTLDSFHRHLLELQPDGPAVQSSLPAAQA